MTAISEIKFSSPHPKLGTPYDLAPVNYKGAKIYRAYFRTKADKLAALLPADVEPLEADELCFYGAELPMQSSAGVYGETQEVHRYLEFGLVVPSKVTKPNGSVIEGMYALVLYLDPFAYATPGRERWGWPKKDCVGNIHVDQSGTSAKLDVSRDGHKLAEVALQYSQPFKQNKLPEPISTDEYWFNWKVIPTVTGEGLDVSQLTEAILPVTIHSYAEGTVDQFDLHNGPADFLAKALPFRETTKAVYLEADFSLPNGTVLFDYLHL